MSNYDVCIVICFYAGQRDGNQQENYERYLTTQKEALGRFRHNASRVVFVISEDGRQEESVTVDHGITYYFRGNRNLSFGGWVDAAKKFPAHDYYIFGEDDYIFCKDDFDRILVDQYNEKGTDYLVNWKQHQGCRGFRGELISTIGITSSKCIQKFRDYNSIEKRFGKNEAMMAFLGTFEGISCLDFYDGFIYWDFLHSAAYYYRGSGEGGVGGFLAGPGARARLRRLCEAGRLRHHVFSADDIDFTKVFVCCYQFYTNNTELF